MSWRDLKVVSLKPVVEPTWREMTFPVYRHLLDLTPSVRHPEQGDPHPIQPVAWGILLNDRPVGLLLAEIPTAAPERSELLSVFVAPELRGRGLGRALVGVAEDELSRAGVREIRAVWTAGKPGATAFERILALQSWSAPASRTVTVRFRPEVMLTLPLFSARHLRVMEFGLELRPWDEVSSEELRELQESNEQQAWVTPGLEPWSYRGGEGFDAATSLVARQDGRIVGWVLNERIDAQRLRFAVSFLDRRWSRRGGIIPLYKQSLEQAVLAGYKTCLFVTPTRYPSMLRFIQKWIARRADFVGETRSSSKQLGS